MAVGLLTLELYLPLNDSLKGKRGILKPIIARLRREYNVSVCEADMQDRRNYAVLEVVCVSTSQTQALASLVTRTSPPVGRSVPGIDPASYLYREPGAPCTAFCPAADRRQKCRESDLTRA